MAFPSWAVAWVVCGSVLGATGGAHATLVAGQDARGTDHFDHDHSNQDLTAVDLSPDPAGPTPSILAEADFSNSTLNGADLTEVVGGCESAATRLDCTTFDRTSLIGAILTNAQLALSSFDSADLSSAAFTGADLAGADFSFADGAAADFTNAGLPNALFGFATLTGTVLVGADLTGTLASDVDLTRSDLTGVDATGAVFERATLQDTVWIDAIAHDVDFSDADLSGIDARCSDSIAVPPVTPPALDTCAEFDGASFRFADLSEGSLQYGRLIASATAPVDLVGADLTRVDFSNACFTALNAGACEAAVQVPPLATADLFGVHVSGARFDGAILTGVDLSFASGVCVGATSGDPDQSVRCPSFVAASLLGANLRQVQLIGAAFTAAQLGGADLTGAFLDGMTSPCSVPTNAAQTPTCMDLGQPSDPATVLALQLDAAVVAGIDFGGLDLTGASFDAADAYVSSSLTDVTTGDPFTVEYTTSFAGATLRNASFASADLAKADFTGADLGRADFTSATLSGADLASASFAMATFAATGTTVIDMGSGSCTLGSGESAVDLLGASLVGADLSGALNFQQGCILVDSTTTYDASTTTFPPGFTLAGQMTNVPEPGIGLLRLCGLLVLGLLGRRRAVAAAGR